MLQSLNHLHIRRSSFCGARLASSHRRWRRIRVCTRGEVFHHGREKPPASRGSGTGNSFNISQDRLDLLAVATSDIRLECSSILVPLARPAARHKIGLIKGGEERLELPTQIQHGSAGSRLTARLRSMEHSVRAAVVLGHFQST